MYSSSIVYHGMMAAVAPRERDVQVGFKPEGYNRRLRRSSEHLSKLDIQNDHHKNPLFGRLLSGPTEEETREEGRALLKEFIVEEIDRAEDLDTPDEIRAELDLCTPQGYANPTWAKAGRDLRRYADDFMKSKERRKVRRRAAEMTENSDDVSQEEFRDLLSALLGDGITRERIIVLFFFCADVTIETLKRKAQSSIQLCQRFIQWSFDFISERVCSWVQENGGWGAVFNSTMAIICRFAAVFGVGMVCYYAYKKFLK